MKILKSPHKIVNVLRFGLIISFSLFLFFSCQKEALISLNDMDSEELCQALLDNDTTAVEAILEDLSADLEADRAGHQNTFDTLIDRLNTADCVLADLSCFECGLSLPPFSIISISVDFNGQEVDKTIRLMGVPDGGIEFMSLE